MISDLLHPGETFIDVGAHVGYLSLVARMAVGDTGFVIAIEPQPYNAHQLLENWRANNFNNIEMISAIAGEEEGFTSLQHQAVTDRAKLSFTDASPGRGLKFKVPVIRLESIVRERVAVVKIDVEGFEPAVIQGLGNAATFVENIILEVLDPSAAAEVTNALAKIGFTNLSTVDGRRWIPGEELPESNVWATRGPSVSAP